jgi:hypothetical protein
VFEALRVANSVKRRPTFSEILWHPPHWLTVRPNGVDRQWKEDPACKGQIEFATPVEICGPLARRAQDTAMLIGGREVPSTLPIKDGNGILTGGYHYKIG